MEAVKRFESYWFEPWKERIRLLLATDMENLTVHSGLWIRASQNDEKTVNVVERVWCESTDG